MFDLFQCKFDSAPASYELAYNTACVYIEDGDWAAAKKSLSVAQSLCSTLLKQEGLSDAEIADEASILRVQEAYLLQCQHDHEAALSLYNEVLHQKPSDPTVVAVADNNLIACRHADEKVFDSLKRSNRALHLQAVDEDKLTVRQRQVMHYNRCLVLLSGKQFTQCRQQVEQMRKVISILHSCYTVCMPLSI